MVDFKKLSDPHYRKHLRLEREANETRLAEEGVQITRTLDMLRDNFDALTVDERKFYISVKSWFAATGFLSQKQKIRLFDIEKKLSDIVGVTETQT